MVETKELQLAKPIDTGNVILVIVYLVAIIVAAYFLTKFIAKRSLRKGMKQDSQHSKRSAFSRFGQKKPEFGHMVSVVDRIAVDRDKTLMVVEFEGKYYLLGTTAEGFEKIDSVRIPAFSDESSEEDMGPPEDEQSAPRRTDGEGPEGQHASVQETTDTDTPVAGSGNKGTDDGKQEGNQVPKCSDVPAPKPVRAQMPDPGAYPPGEETFGKRFKKAFGIVLRSYLPKGMRENNTMSFDEQLQARIKAENEKAGKKSG